MSDETVKHIRRDRPDLPANSAWCGRSYVMAFMFQGLDHVAENGLAKGRLRPCKRCLKRALKGLTFEWPEGVG